MINYEEKQEIKNNLFKEFKKKLKNVEPDFVIKRYLDHSNRDYYCDLFDIFNSFERKEPVEKLFHEAYKAQPKYNETDLEVYQTKLVDHFNRTITFLDALPDDEIKRIQSAFRQQKYKGKTKYKNKYTGECHRDREIVSIAQKLDCSKKDAVESAVDLTLKLAEDYRLEELSERLGKPFEQILMDIIEDKYLEVKNTTK